MSVIDEIVAEIITFCKDEETTEIDREILLVDYIENRSDELLDDVADDIALKLQDHDITVTE